MKSNTIKRALAGAVVAALAGTVAAGHAVGSPRTDHGPATAPGTVADAEYLLGEGLLSLNPAVVDELVADPAFAASISADLRSGDPFTVDEALTALAARAEPRPADPQLVGAGAGTLAVVNALGIAAHISDRMDPRMVGAGVVVTSNSGIVIDLARTGISPIREVGIDPLTSEGLEREQVVAHIIESVGRS